MELEPILSQLLGRARLGAGAFVGIIALTFGDLSASLLQDGPALLRAAFATAVVAAGYFTLRTYVAFHNAQEVYAKLTASDRALLMPTPEAARDRLKKSFSRSGTASNLSEEAAYVVDEYYLGKKLHYPAALVFIVTSIALFLADVWWSAINAACLFE